MWINPINTPTINTVRYSITYSLLRTISTNNLYTTRLIILVTLRRHFLVPLSYLSPTNNSLHLSSGGTFLLSVFINPLYFLHTFIHYRELSQQHNLFSFELFKFLCCVQDGSKAGVTASGASKEHVFSF